MHMIHEYRGYLDIDRSQKYFKHKVSEPRPAAKWNNKKIYMPLIY